MRAVITKEAGGPEVLEVGEVETPTLREGQVLIKTVAAGVNRADVLQRQGHYPPPKGESEIIGLEVSGTIAEVGEGVEGWTVGDECVALMAGGGYAEYVAVDAGQVIPPPAGVDLVTAGSILEVAATVVSNMAEVNLAESESFLVHGGAGGIGTFAIQYAKARGCRVLTTAGSEEKLQHCRDLGADVAIDYHDDWVAAVKEATDGKGVDVILDIMGAKYLPLNVDAIGRNGRIVIIGMQGGVKGELNIGKLLNKAGTVRATSLRFRPTAEKVAIAQKVREEVWPMVESGQVKVEHVKAFPVEEVRAAHEQLTGGSNVGKIVLTF